MASTKNSTNVNLLPNHVFNGNFDDITAYGQINISLKINVPYVLTVYYSVNGVSTFYSENYTETVAPTETKFYNLLCKEKYFRLSLENISQQSSDYLYLQTIYKSSVSVINANVQGSVSVTNFPTSQNINGNVSINNFPASQTISGNVVADVSNFPTGFNINNLPITQTVNGSLTIDNFPKDASGNLKTSIQNSITTDISGQFVNISNFPATQTISGSVIVSNVPTDYGKEITLSSINNTIGTIALNGSTSVLQTSANTKLDTLITNTNNLSGLATSALQNTCNSSLSSINTGINNLTSVLYSGSYYYKTVLNGAVPSNSIVYPSQSFNGKTCYRLHVYNADGNTNLFLWFYDSNVVSPALPTTGQLKFILCVPHGQILQENNLGLYLGAGLRIFMSSSASSPVPFTSSATDFLINISSNPY